MREILLVPLRFRSRINTCIFSIADLTEKSILILSSVDPRGVEPREPSVNSGAGDRSWAHPKIF